MPSTRTFRSGQSLIDVLIASGVGAILLVGALSVLAPALRGTSDAQYAQDGAAYARGLQDQVRSIAASDWNAIASLTPSSTYYISNTGTSSVITAGVETASSTAGPSGLVGHWTFDEGSGTTAADASGSGLTATLQNSPTWRTGTCHAGGCLEFAGGSTQKAFTSSTAILDDDTHTVSFWAKFTGVSATWYQIMAYAPSGSDRSPGIWTTAGSHSTVYWRYNPGDTGISTGENLSTPFSDNTWYMVTGVKDGASFRYYVNGVEVSSSTVVATKSPGSAPIQFGATAFGAAPVVLDDVRIYNRPLTAQEVTSVYALSGTGTSDVSSGFSRSFAVYPVRRSSTGVFVESGGYVDPSTLKLVITYQWPRGASRTLTTFLTRSQSKALVQSDWSGGPGLTGTTTDPGSMFASSTGINATSTTGAFTIDFDTAQSTSSGGGGSSPNISATSNEHYAWSDVLGWINFYSSDTVIVQSSRIRGYASAASGQISLDCATSPAGNVCGSSNYYVTNNGNGTLGGYAWSDAYGWISFSCANTGTCGTSSYGVTINPNTGVFSGYAWNDVAGWISFNCADIAICGTSNYSVVTSWRAASAFGSLDSAIIDTGTASGGQVNGISWTGDKPAGTDLRFQVATASSSAGPWTYVGSDGTESSFYAPDSGAGSALYPWAHPAARYFRYRATLFTDTAQSVAPRVDDVVVRWSP